MGLYEAIEEVTEAENKALSADKPEKEEKEHVEIKEDSAAISDTERKSKDSKEKPAEKAADVKDEAEKAAGEDSGKESPAADSPPDAAAFARMRREKAAADRRAEAAEAALRSAPNQPQPHGVKAIEKAADAEPDPNLDPEAHLRWKLSKTENQLREIAEWKNQKDQQERQVSLKSNAVKAFEDYENAFMPTVKDYKEVTEFGIQAIKSSIMTLNPNLKGQQLGEAIERQILRLAAQAEQEGHDPAEYLYHQARSWGYKPAQPAVQKVEEKTKPSLKDIAGHKKRSVSSMAGGKSGNSPLSREAVLDKSFGLQDFAKLTPSQLRELEQMEG